MSPSANDTQVGGQHYRGRKVQHWDYACQLPYLDGQISKYVDRHGEKGGLESLLKAEHYLHKAMEYYYPEEYAAHLASKPDHQTQGPASTMTVHDLNIRHQSVYAVQGPPGVTAEVAVHPIAFVDDTARPMNVDDLTTGDFGERVVAANLPERRKRSKGTASAFIVCELDRLDKPKRKYNRKPVPPKPVKKARK